MVNNGVRFISIDGHGGSGKSTLAKKLAESLNAEIIHIDDFTGLGATSDWYKALTTNVIKPAMSGSRALSYPRAKWWAEHDPEPTVNQMVTEIMIVEGVCSSRAELRDYMALKIFVDTPRDICIQRGLARDKGMGGKSDDEVLAQWNQWLEWDDEYFAKDDPQSIADIVISGMDNYDQAVNNIILMIKQTLN